jgi:hypothetical protein
MGKVSIEIEKTTYTKLKEILETLDFMEDEVSNDDFDELILAILKYINKKTSK